MAKEKKEQTESKGKLQDTLDALNKKYGIGTVSLLDAKTTGEYDIISTGSIGFDYIVLGVGGFVKGKLYEVMGWECSGKSTVCAHAAAECQKKGGVVHYIDSEHALDKVYFRSLGVDTTKLFISQPSSGEEGFAIAVDMVRSGGVDLLIIDSDSSLIPKKVVDGEVGDSAIGLKARLNSSVYPKLKNALVDSNTCVIVVSQYREKIGMMYGDPKTTQGGHALKYYADCRIEISKTLAKNGDVIIGNLTKVKATKNKTASPYRTSEFIIIYGIGIDRVDEMINLLINYDLGKKWGTKFTVNSVKYELEDFKALIVDNPEFYEELKEKIIDKIKNTDNVQQLEEIVSQEGSI